MSDLRFALRTLLRTPGFTLVAVLSLALGIGANSAIFSVARALLLRPLPYANADRLVILWNTSPGLGITEDWFSTAQYFDIRHGSRAFEHLAIAIGGNENLTGQGDPARVGTIRVSSNLLPMLGARPSLGRLFLPEDDTPGRSGTAVLGHGTWTRRFGAEPDVVGRAITLNGTPYTVVGVLPPAFSLPREVLPTLGGAEDAEVLLPLPLGPDDATVRRGEDYNLLATLKPGATVQQAQAEMGAITARLRDRFPEFYPANGGLTFAVIPLHEYVVGDVRQAGPVDRSRRDRAAGRLRERRQPPAGTRDRPPARAGRPRGDWRQPMAVVATDADRKPAAGRAGWRCGPGAGAMGP